MRLRIKVNYRREIDGLRAFAVLPVVFYHAGFEKFSGGYIGVDVFFVISGYLITAIIISELQQDNFSILNFYERRARRILPVLLFVVLICIPLAWIWLLPKEFESFSQSLLAVAMFVSNISFWQSGGYFDTQLELQPLLHTWSLAVEKQFYILFPLLLVSVWKYKKKWIPTLLGITLISSFLISEWGTYYSPSGAFYLLPSRAWELLAGSIVAVYLAKNDNDKYPKIVSEVGSWFGITLIVFSILSFDKSTLLPGFHALLPTLGTVLIILFTTSKTLLGRIASLKVFVVTGLISYSIYLWHFPLFSFARHKNLTEPSPTTFLQLIVLTIVLAFVSWKFIELPFRSQSLISRRKFFTYSALGIIILFAIGTMGKLTDGFKHRLPPNLTWESLGDKIIAYGEVCKPQPIKGLFGVNACKFGSVNGDRTIILYGDSHADSFSWQLDHKFRETNITGIRVKLEGCGIVPEIVDIKSFRIKDNNCDKKFSNLIEYVKTENADVIISVRWSFRLYPLKGFIEEIPYRNSEGGVEVENDNSKYGVIENGKLVFSPNIKELALKKFLDRFLDTKSQIFLVYPVPEIGWNIAKKNWLYYTEKEEILDEISIPYDDYKIRNRFILDIFDSYSNNKNLFPIKPSTVFCDTFISDRCVAQYNKVPYYFDDDHLSDMGAKLVIDKYLKNIMQNNLK